jgi:hypothetical protein
MALVAFRGERAYVVFDRGVSRRRCEAQRLPSTNYIGEPNFPGCSRIRENSDGFVLTPGPNPKLHDFDYTAVLDCVISPTGRQFG